MQVGEPSSAPATVHQTSFASVKRRRLLVAVTKPATSVASTKPSQSMSSIANKHQVMCGDNLQHPQPLPAAHASSQQMHAYSSTASTQESQHMCTSNSSHSDSYCCSPGAGKPGCQCGSHCQKVLARAETHREHMDAACWELPMVDFSEMHSKHASQAAQSLMLEMPTGQLAQTASFANCTCCLPCGSASQRHWRARKSNSDA